MFGLAILLILLSMFFIYLALTTWDSDGVYGFLGIIFGVISLFALEFAVNQHACKTVWKMSNTPSEYGVFTGCMIEIDGKWIPEKNYREFEE